MALKFASLGSGSAGNALLISVPSDVPGARSSTVLLDCGFGIREAERRLARVGMAAADLDAIVVTHEHQDHVGGVFRLARRHRIPVWLSHGTWRAMQHESDGIDLHVCRDGQAFSVGSLELLPYTVPHDAREPLQYTATDGRVRLGVLTDAGHATDHMIGVLGGCNALVLECNHDRQMLADSAYPPSLKRRVGGAYGHLSNDAAAAILAAVNQSNLATVIGAHLSRKNNSSVLAHAALQAAVHSPDTEIQIACQDEGFSWIELN